MYGDKKPRAQACRCFLLPSLPLPSLPWTHIPLVVPSYPFVRYLIQHVLNFSPPFSFAPDVFSFGILLWQLATGEMMPYGTCTVPQILVGVSQGVVRSGP